MYKSMIAPFIGVVAITLQLVFGIELDTEVQENITTALVNVIVVGTVVYGIIKNHKK